MSKMSRGLLEAALVTADPNNNQQFMHLLLFTMQELSLTVRDVAEMIGVSLPTVERWMNGQSTPHPAMRPPTYKMFVKLLKAD